ncbi:HAD-IA family hydrolase [Corynebacterium glutamicum]|uniref:HAD-IA family hydrolase n=1 Tax=Corynebacterium glutamicum TaxID=1718 RepID=UPI0030BA2829
MMRGLIVDYAGVLDGTDEDQRRWRNLLAAAKKNGVGTAILSNDPGGLGAAPIRELETNGVVDKVLLSGELGVEKPEEAAFQAAADAIDLPMRDCVLVDDSILNVRGAVEAGLVGVYYQQFDRAVVEIVGLFGLEGEF